MVGHNIYLAAVYFFYMWAADSENAVTPLTTNVQTLLITYQEGCGKVFQQRIDLGISCHSHSFQANMGLPTFQCDCLQYTCIQLSTSEFINYHAAVGQHLPALEHHPARPESPSGWRCEAATHGHRLYPAHIATSAMRPRHYPSLPLIPIIQPGCSEFCNTPILRQPNLGELCRSAKVMLVAMVVVMLELCQDSMLGGTPLLLMLIHFLVKHIV